MFGFRNKRRRDALRSRPFPVPWRNILRKRVAFYRRLNDADGREMEGHIELFPGEKNFERFFENPPPLREGHPELHEELKGFYRHDPVTFCAPPAREGVAGEGGS